jgi:hypothetical protein
LGSFFDDVVVCLISGEAGITASVCFVPAGTCLLTGVVLRLSDDEITVVPISCSGAETIFLEETACAKVIVAQVLNKKDIKTFFFMDLNRGS